MNSGGGGGIGSGGTTRLVGVGAHRDGDTSSNLAAILPDKHTPPIYANMYQALEKIAAFTDHNYTVYKDVYEYLEKRIQMEQEHARALYKLAKNSMDTNPDIFSSNVPLAKVWHNMLKLFMNDAEKRLEGVTSSVNLMPDTLKDLENSRRTIKAEKEKHLKTLKMVYIAESKARTKYNQATSELEAVLPTSDKAEQLRKKLFQIEKDADETVIGTNKMQEKYFNSILPEILERYHGMNELIGVQTEGVLKEFFSVILEMIPNMENHASGLSEFMAQCDFVKTLEELTDLEIDENFQVPEHLTGMQGQALPNIGDDEAYVPQTTQSRTFSNLRSKKSVDLGRSNNSPVKPTRQVDNNVVILNGWLEKQGDAVKNWKRRWTVLTNDFCLCYYRNKDEYLRGADPLGKIILPSYKIEKTTEVKMKNAFKASHSGMRTYFFSAETPEIRDRWIEYLHAATQLMVMEPAPEFDTSDKPNDPSKGDDSSDEDSPPSTSSSGSFGNLIMPKSATGSFRKFSSFLVSAAGSSSNSANSSPSKAAPAIPSTSPSPFTSPAAEATPTKSNGAMPPEPLEAPPPIPTIAPRTRASILARPRPVSVADPYATLAEAIKDFVPNMYDDTALGFHKGDVIIVEELNESGQWKGTIRGTTKTGCFPSRLVKILNKPGEISNSVSNSSISELDENSTTAASPASIEATVPASPTITAAAAILVAPAIAPVAAPSIAKKPVLMPKPKVDAAGPVATTTQAALPAESSPVTNNPEPEAAQKPAPKRRPAPTPPKVSERTMAALYNCTATMEGELSITIGETLVVLDDSHPDWIQARNNQGQIGYVPRNYVDLHQ